MANTYEQIKILANKNNMGLSNTINRDYGIPLDSSSVQETYEAALSYAKTSTLAYIGQPISVGDTLYVVTDEAGGYLKAVGTVPVGDDISITVAEDGKISLVGFVAAPLATLPRKAANGTIEWVSIDAIVAGDGNEKTRIKTADNSAITVSTDYDEVNNIYTYTLGIDLPAAAAVPDYTLSKETGKDQVTYTLSKDGVPIGETIAVPNAYDDTKLAGRVTALETHSYVDDVAYDANSKKVYLVSDGVQLGTGFDASAFIKDGMIESVTLKDNKLVITWNTDVDTDNNDEKDVTEISLTELIDVYEAGNGIVITEKTITVDETKIATVSALNNVKATAEAAQTSEQVNAAISTALTTYAKTAEVESALQPYAKAADIALTYATTTALSDANNIATDAQNRVGIVEGKIRDITSVGGEPNVLEIIKVNGVTQTVTDRVVDITVPTKVSDLSGTDALQTAINQNTATLTALDTRVTGLDTSITGHATRLAELAAKDAELLSAIQENKEKFNSYSTTEQVNTKISEEIAAIDLSTYITESDVKEITDTLADRISDIEDNINKDGGNVYEQLKTVNTKLAMIEGNGAGSINKALADANSYADQAEADAIAASKNHTDAEVAKDRTRISSLETANTTQASSIAQNTSALTAITEKLGNGYSKEFTIETAIADAKQVGTSASSAVEALIKGAVASNTSSITQLRTDLTSEITARETADTSLDRRLTKVEAFFDDAAEDSEGLNNALDKLVDIQNFLSGEGSTVDQMLDAISANTASCNALTQTVGTSSSGIVKDVADIKHVISGYTTEGEIKAAVTASKTQADKGVTDAAAAKKAVDDLAIVVGVAEQVLETTKSTAEAAQEQAESNADEITSIKANYISFADSHLFTGGDIIIFDCGGAEETIIPT